jgi:hypothetical protein
MKLFARLYLHHFNSSSETMVTADEEIVELRYGVCQPAVLLLPDLTNAKKVAGLHRLPKPRD